MERIKNVLKMRHFLMGLSLVFAFFAPPSINGVFAQNQGQQDGIVRFFDKYLDDEDFTVVFITPKMFQMIAKLSSNDPDAANVKEILKDLRGLRVLTSEKNGVALYKEALTKFSNADYELLMKVRDGKENVNFWTREENGHIVELLLLVGGQKEFTLISFLGNIDLQKLSRLSDKINIEGADHLKKLNKKPKTSGDSSPE
jgi:hypothetical protein